MKYVAGLLVIAGLWGIARVYAAPPDETVPWRQDSNPVGLQQDRSPAATSEKTGQDNASLSSPPVNTIDLATALRLAGVQNPAILLARQRVVEAVVQRQLAAAVFLPSLNAGLNYDSHTGPLQQSSGNILKVNRGALYLGAGANAVASGTVNIPGVVFNYHVSDAIFSYFAAKQLVAARRFANQAAQNEALRRVAVAYIDLVAAEARRSVAFLTRKEAEEVKRLADERVKAKLGRKGDADRAATEAGYRAIEVVDAEQQVQSASARLAALLNLDPRARLHPAEERLVPMPVVPDPVPLSELLAIALLQRPEMGENRALVRKAMLDLANAKLLPFAPTLIVGFSAGTFGGGSGLVANSQQLPRFGTFGPRNDFDAVAFWTLQNLGVGNRALVNIAGSKWKTADLERLAVLNRIRAEVADASIRTHIRFAQIAANEVAIRSGLKAYQEDYNRVKNNVGLPIELLASLRLLNRARNEYTNAIADYNQAQLELYVALGQPPMDALARPVERGER
jgi:outer membrane protein TolC